MYWLHSLLRCALSEATTLEALAPNPRIYKIVCMRRSDFRDVYSRPTNYHERFQVHFAQIQSNLKGELVASMAALKIEHYWTCSSRLFKISISAYNHKARRDAHFNFFAGVGPNLWVRYILIEFLYKGVNIALECQEFLGHCSGLVPRFKLGLWRKFACHRKNMGMTDERWMALLLR